MPLTPIQQRNVVQISIGSLAIAIGLCAVSLLSVGGIPWRAQAAEEKCCKAGDETPPLELVKQVPKGELHSPYPDYVKMAKDDPDLVKQFRLPGCNECHGGGGGGGICPALTQGVWFWGNTDDVLFRLVTLGSVDLEKQGYKRLSYGTVHAPMPPMGATIKSADQLWKIRLHPVDQSSRCKSSRESAPLRMTAARSALADRT